MTQILVFGDSITYGAWDIEGGWVQRLRKYFDKKTVSKPEFWNSDFPLIYNLGISGNTITDVLNRFKDETDAKLVEKDEGENIFFIFNIGVNDCCILKRENRFVTSPYDFDTTLCYLINAAKRYSNYMLFVGAGMVDESRTTPVPWDDNRSYLNKYILYYNKLIKSGSVKL
ncbi:MAG: GDSL-type esterase/lipase family protein [Candidatus Ratteibacteria bacterium]|nr:GDSL-type esterase/lipase family protein [Candidatus Ratteibacteria bacterium]